MTIIAGSNGDTSKYPSVPIGVHKARCVRIIDLDTQKNEYQGQISWKRQVLIIWEVPEELDSKNEPMTISKWYTLSLHDKSTLGGDLTSWRGRAFTETEKQGFDITKLSGVACNLNVVEGKTGKPKISSVMPLSKKDTIAEQFHPTLVFSLDDFQSGKKETFNQISEGIRNIILRSKELEGMNQDLGDENNGSDMKVGESEVPF